MFNDAFNTLPRDAIAYKQSVKHGANVLAKQINNDLIAQLKEAHKFTKNEPKERNRYRETGYC